MHAHVCTAFFASFRPHHLHRSSNRMFLFSALWVHCIWMFSNKVSDKFWIAAAAAIIPRKKVWTCAKQFETTTAILKHFKFNDHNENELESIFSHFHFSFGHLWELCDIIALKWNMNNFYWVAFSLKYNRAEDRESGDKCVGRKKWTTKHINQKSKHQFSTKCLIIHSERADLDQRPT